MTAARRIEERVSLAHVYFEDGALHSAARVLREAADLIEQLADQQNPALGIPSPATDTPSPRHPRAGGDPDAGESS
jgi:hypothetical protein